MKIYKNKVVQSFVFLFIGLMAIEISFRLISGFTIFNYSLIRVCLASVIGAIIVGYLTSFFKAKVMWTINMLFLLICNFYAFMQLAFFAHMGVYMSMGASSQLNAVLGYIPEFIHAIKPEFYLVFMPALILGLILIITSIVSKKVRNKKGSSVFKLKRQFRYQNTIMLLSSMIIVLLSSMGYYYFLSDEYQQDEYQAVAIKDLFISASNPGLCIKEFGVLPFSLMDIKNKFYPVDDITLLNIAYTPNSEAASPREFDDSTWQRIIASETNPIYNNLNNFFINNIITSKNEMTGIFKNKNLIMIMMESVNDVIENEEYFPNFNKLKNDGWYFANNYAPRNSCATGNNELSSLIGLHSTYNECTANIYMNNTYFTSIFNLFNDKNYYTNSFHNYNDTYYYRTIYHPNLGSQLYHDADYMELAYDPGYGDWASDEDLIDYYLKSLDEEVDTKKPFMSYLITVTSHRPYDRPNIYGDMYYDLTEDEEFSEDLKRYYSKLKVLDNALGNLIDGLKKRNLLDDTIIVLYGDHYPYGLSNEVLNETLDRDLEDYENERVPLVIYNPKLESMVVEKYTSYINLTPTIANLFDLDYDPRLYVGQDVFSDEYQDFVSFADLSWKNDKAFYNATTGMITYNGDETYTDAEIRDINNIVYARNNASMLAIRYNYFAYLEEKMKEFEKEITS